MLVRLQQSNAEEVKVRKPLQRVEQLEEIQLHSSGQRVSGQVNSLSMGPQLRESSMRDSVCCAHSARVAGSMFWANRNRNESDQIVAAGGDTIAAILVAWPPPTELC